MGKNIQYQDHFADVGKTIAMPKETKLNRYAYYYLIV